MNTAAGWSISAEAAADPAKLEAITQFLHFFYGEDQYPRYLQAVNGIPATREEIYYPQPEAMPDVLRVMNDPKIGKSMSIADFSGRNMPPSQFTDWFYETAQDWLTGNMSVETAMKEADWEWDTLTKLMSSSLNRKAPFADKPQGETAGAVLWQRCAFHSGEHDQA